ncbi:MAG TPA: transcriptional regulator [Vicinamibacterales bacterium]|jgi:predicted DNA-binding transcriptional regulator YafY|nr:transcriptional regulator [Vicinamibacterales bacterium]
MARNSELIRQWQILRAIDASRNGLSIAKLAEEREVHQRTIRRDLEALQKAGFPLYDTKVNGSSMWKMQPNALRGLADTTWSVTELCALYFSRTMMDALAGAPFEAELSMAFAKLDKALPAKTRRFLDRLPGVLYAKPTGRKKKDDRRTRDILARAIDASLEQRRAIMRYDSVSSRRAKEYIVEPHRLAYAHGGIYLIAYVPEYGQLRTFALERIETFAITDERFEPRPLPEHSFEHSLGVHSGTPVDVAIEFDPRVAEYVKGRDWHRSQTVQDLPDGGVRMTLNVCDDRPLRSWILSFGPLARVLAPSQLAQEILEEIQEARERYMPRLMFDAPRMELPSSDSDMQRRLPMRTRMWRVTR